jgi:hypothetical protein
MWEIVRCMQPVGLRQIDNGDEKEIIRLSFACKVLSLLQKTDCPFRNCLQANLRRARCIGAKSA